MLYQLSYGPLFPFFSADLSASHHGQGQNRTADTMIFSHVLYQLSYLAPTKQKTARAFRAAGGKLVGEAGFSGSPLPPATAGSTYPRPSRTGAAKRPWQPGQTRLANWID